MNIDSKLPKIDTECDVLPIDGLHGVCRSYYQPDILDLTSLDYIAKLRKSGFDTIYALDLGCSPYFPQSQRFAKQGCIVDALDMAKPIDDFDLVNEKYQHRINYQICDLSKPQTLVLKNNYQIVYSNRCLSFMRFHDARELLKLLVAYTDNSTNFFLNFFSTVGHYADSYPVDLPLENRFVQLDSEVAKRSSMLALVCLYTLEEIEGRLFSGLPIKLLEVLESKTGSHKIVAGRDRDTIGSLL